MTQPTQPEQPKDNQKKKYNFYDYLSGRAFGSFHFLLSPLLIAGLMIVTVTIGPILFIVYILKGNAGEIY